MSNEFYKILEKLNDNKVPFCFQSQGEKNFYNLKVRSPLGNDETIQSSDFNVVEQRLKIMWGHIINTMPVPTGFPIPGVTNVL